MSNLEPRDMRDMTGWHTLTCDQSDVVMNRHKGFPSSRFEVASTLTDPDGIYGPPVIFTEWWLDGHPLLREYRRDQWRGDCRHYGAMDDTAAIERES